MFGKTVTVYEGELALRFRDGQLVGKLGPGRHRLNPRRDGLIRRWGFPSWTPVAGQEILTKEGAQVRCNLWLRVSVVDLEKVYSSGGTEATGVPLFHAMPSSVYQPVNLIMAAKAELTAWLKERTLEECMSTYTEIGRDLAESLGRSAEEGGLKLHEIQVIDFSPSGSIRTAALDLLRAEMEGKAALQRARNEAATMRSLLNTARLVRENPGLLEVRAFAAGQKNRISLNFNTPSSPVQASKSSPPSEKQD